MKTISGRVLSSKPISLSKASSTLSTFISAENGASQALCAYLRRASNSFNELKQLHKELRASRPDRKHRKTKLETVSEGETAGENRTRSEVSQELNNRVEDSKKKRASQSQCQERINHSENKINLNLVDGNPPWNAELSPGAGDDAAVEKDKIKRKKTVGASDIGSKLENEVEDNTGWSLKVDQEVEHGDKIIEPIESGRKKHKKKVENYLAKNSYSGDEAEARRNVSRTENKAEENMAGSVEFVGEKGHGDIGERDSQKRRHKRRRNVDEFGSTGVNGGEIGEGDNGCKFVIEVAENPSQNVELSQEIGQRVQHNTAMDSERKKHKKRKKNRDGFGDFEEYKDQVRDEGGQKTIEIHEEKGNKKIKKKKEHDVSKL